MSKFSVTEFRQRLRPLTRRCAAMEGLVQGQYSIELQERYMPLSILELPETDEGFIHPDDDLKDFARIDDRKEWLASAGLLDHGALVHVAVNETGEWGGELRNVFIVWMGTPEQDARIVSAPALRTYEELIA